MCFMPKNFVQKTFNRWLYVNRKHFTHQPRIVLKRKDFFILQFSGIVPEIKCIISQGRKGGTFNIYVEYQNELWDIIAEFDVDETRTPDGRYYCHSCLPEYKEQFSSRKELWKKHCFEALLEWTKENFKESHRLCLFGSKCHSTSAFILGKNEMDEMMKKRRDFTGHVLRVVKNKR